MAQNNEQAAVSSSPPGGAPGLSALQTVKLPIVEVTLLEDRARVIRRGAVELAEGFVKLQLAEVTPVVSDRTVAARLVGAKGRARVVEARVRRRMVTRSDDAAPAAEGSLAELEQRLEELDAEIDDLESQLRTRKQAVDSLAELARLSLAELSEDAAWNQTIGVDREKELDGVGEQQRQHQRQLLELNEKLMVRRADQTRLGYRIDVLQSPATKETGSIELELSVTTAGSYQLELDYVVPNACWRPQHRARLTMGAETSVELSTDAAVWQNTGEDWIDAVLIFSTERASLGTEPPELTTDRLRVQRKSAGVQVETRAHQVQDVGLGAEPVAAAELPGIDDGGEVVSLRAPKPATVPSDGEPHRVPLGTFVSPAKCELVSYPELSPCVLLRTTQTNRSSHPILAGPVDLIRHSGLCGRTSVLFIAAGETLELGWGPDAELRVKRSEDVSDEDRGMLSSWSTREHHIEVRLSNLGATAKSVRVRERVPVSEIDKVKVVPDRERSSAGKVPDGDGFVDWDVALDPFGQATLDLHYSLAKHQDVVGL